MTAIYFQDRTISYKELLSEVEKRVIKDPIFPVTHTLDCVLNVLTCFIKGIPFHPYSPHLMKTPLVAFSDGCDIILHTSGSSKMKFLSFSREAFIESCMNTHPAFMLEQNDVYLLNLPLYHVAGICLLLRAFLRGAAIAIDPTDTSIITHVSMVPTQTEILLDQNPFSNLKALLLGGSKIQPSLADTLVDKGYPLYVTYGSTEMCSHVFVEKYQTGKGIYFTRPLRGRNVTIRQDGTLMVKPSWSDTFHDTKDRFTYENGKYRVLERVDDMFISGGENIYPDEIRRALLEISGIERVEIEIKEHLKWGNRPFVSVYAEQGITLEWIMQSLSQTLERFKIPKEHEIALCSKAPSSK